MTTSQTAFAKGTIAALNRARDDNPLATIAELRQQIERLEHNLNRARQELRTRDDTIEQLQAHKPVPEDYITMAAAARIGGVSIATACRYLNTGYWHGYQPKGTNIWRVNANQAFTKKSSSPRLRGDKRGV